MSNEETIIDSNLTISGDTTQLIKGALLLGLYQVESDAIRGGMGQVFRVRHTGWDVDLALKQPQASLFQTEQQKELFIRECEAWIGLGLHPHIVSCYYVREINGIPSIFSEWMDGGSLSNWIKAGRLYTSSEQEQLLRILDIAIQFARGLYYAHEQGLIHQDVKPDNLLLTADGDAKVADFGIARARTAVRAKNAGVSPEGGTMLSESGSYTPAYCSVEQMNGKPLTRRTDIWSWAVSVLEMLLGERPWQNGVVAGIECEEYFEQARVKIPSRLRSLLARCFEEDESGRPRDFLEVETTLLTIYQQEAGSEYPRKSPKAAKDTADSLNNMALSFVDIGKPEDARELWQKALLLDPSHLASNFNNTMHEWRTGRVLNATVSLLLREIADNHAGDDRVLWLMGQFELEQCNYKAAAELFGKVRRKTEYPEIESLIRLAEQQAAALPEGPYFDHPGKLAWAENGDLLCGSPEGLSQCQIGSTEPSFSPWPQDQRAFLSFSPDGSFAATWDQTDGNGKINIWNVSSGTLLQSIDIAQECRPVCVFFRINNTELYIVNKSSASVSLRSYRIQDANVLFDQSFDLDTHEGRAYDSANAIDLSPDAAQLLCADRRGNIHVFELYGEQHKVFETEAPAGQEISAAAFSPDNRHMLAQIWRNMYLFDIASGTCVQKFICLDNASFFCFTPVGRLALAAGRDITLWDLSSAQSLYDKRLSSLDMVLYAVSAALRSGEASGDSCAAICKNSGEIMIVPIPSSVETQRKYWMLSKITSTEKRASQEQEFRHIREQAELALQAGDVAMALDWIERSLDLPEFENAPERMALNDLIGRRCFIKGVRAMFPDGPVPGMGEQRTLGDNSLTRFENNRRNICFSPDGKYIFGRHTLRDLQAETNLLECTETDVACFTFDNTKVFFAPYTGQGRVVQYYDIERGALFDLGSHATEVTALAVCADGRHLISGDAAGAIKLWDYVKGKCIRTLETNDSVSNLYFLQDSDTALACSRSAIREINLKNGRILREYEGAYRFFTDCALSPDKKYIMANAYCTDPKFDGLNYRIVILDAATGDLAQIFEKLDSDPFCQTSAVRFSPGGRMAVSTLSNGNLRYWGLQNGKCYAHLTGGGYSPVFHPDGNSIVTSAGSKGLQRIRLDHFFKFPGWSDWHENAEPYLRDFLLQHPGWTEHDFPELISELQNRELGWLRPESIYTRLKQLR